MIFYSQLLQPFAEWPPIFFIFFVSTLQLFTESCNCLQNPATVCRTEVFYFFCLNSATVCRILQLFAELKFFIFFVSTLQLFTESCNCLQNPATVCRTEVFYFFCLNSATVCRILQLFAELKFFIFFLSQLCNCLQN